MNNPPTAIRIAPLQPGELDLLCLRMDPRDDGADHQGYAEMQSRGEGVYLVAWDGTEPVGHCFIRWTGSTEAPRILDQHPEAAQYAGCPEYTEVYVLPERRSQGIGAQMLRRALQLSREHGATQATITVDVANPRARALYERLGFVETGIGVFTTSGVYIDKDGQEIPWQNGPQVMLWMKLSNYDY